MLLTLATIRQLPQAMLLADSFHQHADRPDQPSVIIGLTDDPAKLPADFKSPYPLLFVTDLLDPALLATLSARYTPTEFSAACKPLFVQAVFNQFPDVDQLLYADPNIRFYSSLAPIWQQLTEASVVLTPHMTRAPNDQAWPDEKMLQNVGLFSADFLGFRRSAETDRMLAWWHDRVTERAFINFCEGLCTDQLWLMHVPVFFLQTRIVHDPSWHVALWNLHDRPLRQTATGWQLAETGAPLRFANLKGLYNQNEGFFPHQTRLNVARTDVATLLTDYRKALVPYANVSLTAVAPAYGQQPEPVIVRGWRRTTTQVLRRVTQFIDQVPLPVLR